MRKSELSPQELAFLQSRRVARLATVSENCDPSNIPVCFVYKDNRVYIPLDEKPKSVAPTYLRRVRNIVKNPLVSLVVDRYSEDWDCLAYIQIQGKASLLHEGSDYDEAIAYLRAKYSQYLDMNIQANPLIVIEPEYFNVWGRNFAPDRSDRDLMTIIRERRSVRWFLPEPIPGELVGKILEAGRWAPSPHGVQPWRFVVLTSESRRQELAEAMAETWRYQLEMDGQEASVVEQRLAKSKARLISAPLVVILCLYLQDLDRYPDPDRQQAEEIMAIQSLGAAAQNMLLAAYALGLEGGWMCAPLFCPDTVRDVLHLDASLIPHAMLTFGFMAREPVRKPHKPVEDLVVLYD